MAPETKHGVSCRGLNDKAPCSTSYGHKSVSLHKPSGAKSLLAHFQDGPTMVAPPRSGLRCAPVSSHPTRHSGSGLAPPRAVRSGRMNLFSTVSLPLLRLLSVRLGVGERPVVPPLCGVGPILLTGIESFPGPLSIQFGPRVGSPRMHLDHADLQSRCGFSKSTFIGRKAPPLATSC